MNEYHQIFMDVPKKTNAACNYAIVGNALPLPSKSNKIAVLKREVQYMLDNDIEFSKNNHRMDFTSIK